MTILCHLSDIPDGNSKSLTSGTDSFVAVRKQRQVWLYRNRCPHRGIPLEWQPDQFLDYDRQFIQCSTHGALFRIDNGLCIQGPCSGQSLDSVSILINENDEIVLLHEAAPSPP